MNTTMNPAVEAIKNHANNGKALATKPVGEPLTDAERAEAAEADIREARERCIKAVRSELDERAAIKSIARAIVAASPVGERAKLARARTKALRERLRAEVEAVASKVDLSTV